MALKYYVQAAACIALLLSRAPVQELRDAAPPGPAPGRAEIVLIKQLDQVALSYFYALKLMHAGDLHGQHSTLEAYNYDQVLHWLALLVDLNPTSEIAPFLATFYFSGTNKSAALYHIIEFLKDYANTDVTQRWRWQAYGIYLAHHRLRDLAYASQLASDLIKDKPSALPLWVKELPGMLLIKMDEHKQAHYFFRNLLESNPDLSKEERLYLEEKVKLFSN